MVLPSRPARPHEAGAHQRAAPDSGGSCIFPAWPKGMPAAPSSCKLENRARALTLVLASQLWLLMLLSVGLFTTPTEH